MANIRIKDLSTTAAVTASDDFIAVDGATNGTRKLNAYSPTFGGNLTVSGSSGANVFSGEIQANKSDSNLSFAAYGTTPKSGIWTQSDGTMVWADYATGTKSLKLNMTTGAATLAGNLTVSGTGTSSFGGIVSAGQSADFRLGNTYSRVAQSDGGGGWLGGYNINYTSGARYDSTGTIAGHYFSPNGYNLYTGTSQSAGTAATAALTIDNSRNATLSGNLTVSGTGNNILNSGGGNFLIGTTTDGGQKLQVSGTAAISGALSIGNTVQTAVSVASTHKVTISIGGSTYYLLATNV